MLNLRYLILKGTVNHVQVPPHPLLPYTRILYFFRAKLFIVDIGNLRPIFCKRFYYFIMSVSILYWCSTVILLSYVLLPLYFGSTNTPLLWNLLLMILYLKDGNTVDWNLFLYRCFGVFQVRVSVVCANRIHQWIEWRDECEDELLQFTI